MNTEKLKTQVKQAWEEKPLEVIAAVSTAALAVGKLANGVASMQNSRTWKKEVKRRDRMTK